MRIKKVFCLFEQSGTFKNAFREYGIKAEDYDILNDFNETEHQVDIFAEIDKAYEGKSSIFDEMNPEDLCMAFFPCTRFESQIHLAFRGEAYQQKECSDKKGSTQVKRSLMHPQFAERFIKTYILDKEDKIWL